ncbi:Uncharacterised protein [Mycobacterium tuberculosis]|nr:Uncharacterised protein [Mycobacterium tuberculosis]COV74564.1 Uncharacterised protein [Mycobacterium tuberculosis]
MQDCRWPGGADGNPQGARNAGRRGAGSHRIGAVHHVATGRQRHRGVGDLGLAIGGTPPQRNVYRPVVATRCGELAGAIQRVNNPHPIGFQPGQIVVGLLTEHCVTRPFGLQPSQQQRVSLAVTGFPERPWLIETDLRTHLEQQLSRVRRQVGGQLGVSQVVRQIRCGRAHHFSIAELNAGI